MDPNEGGAVGSGSRLFVTTKQSTLMICCDWRFRGLIYCTIICAIQPAGRIISESINVMQHRALIHKEVGDI